MFCFALPLVTEYGCEKLLTPLLDNLYKLETEGLIIKFENQSFTFKGSLSVIIADNLAAHALGGFFCNFSTVQRFCRHCNFTKDQLQHPETLFDFGVRTTVGYNKNLLSVQDYPQLSATYGIKEPSCFSKLNHFHVVHGFPPDLAHDLFKGFAIDLTTNVVVYFVQEGHLSLRELNDAIEQFDYSESDKKNKPQPFKIKSLNQFKTKETACEMWNLLRLLPLMCGHQIPTGNDVWMLYTKLLQITERLCAMEFSNGDLLALETLLREFFQE